MFTIIKITDYIKRGFGMAFAHFPLKVKTDSEGDTVTTTTVEETNISVAGSPRSIQRLLAAMQADVKHAPATTPVASTTTPVGNDTKSTPAPQSDSAGTSAAGVGDSQLTLLANKKVTTTVTKKTGATHTEVDMDPSIEIDRTCATAAGGCTVM